MNGAAARGRYLHEVGFPQKETVSLLTLRLCVPYANLVPVTLLRLLHSRTLQLSCLVNIFDTSMGLLPHPEFLNPLLPKCFYNLNTCTSRVFSSLLYPGCPYMLFYGRLNWSFTSWPSLRNPGSLAGLASMISCGWGFTVAPVFTFVCPFGTFNVWNLRVSSKRSSTLVC